MKPSLPSPQSHERPQQEKAPRKNTGALAVLAGWGVAIGAQRVAAKDVEREFGLPAGKIAKGAGIESVARVAEGEDECTLAARACEAALAAAGADIGAVECVIATSETHAGYPSLGALLHAQLLADPQVAVFDVGGCCLGVVNALAVAQSLIAAGSFRRVLVATADVHSRILTPARVKGEFGALFGDGASAFVMAPAADGQPGSYCPGEFIFGCDATAASAIRVGLTRDLSLELKFNGGELARAAVTRLQELIADLELRSGAGRATASSFATHQPNPRLVDLLARQLRVPREKFPAVARTHGNLGSSTCGVALSMALTECAARPEGERGPIFVAALGPGLLWGGTVLLPGSQQASAS
jgi:3-oxoacyl-[acyl-carrier-protein] synthase-3